MLRQRFQLPLYPSPSPQNRLQQRFRKISFFFLNPRGHHFTSDFKNTTMEYPVSPSDLFQISGGNLRSTVIWTHCDFRQVRSNFLLLHAVGVKAFSWSWAQLPRSFSARHEADGLFEVECCPSPSPVLWQVLPMGTSAWICLSWSMSLLPSLQRSTRYHYFLNEKNFYWGIVALQSCVRFCGTTKRIRYMHTCTPPSWASHPTAGSSRSAGLGSLCCAAAFQPPSVSMGLGVCASAVLPVHPPLPLCVHTPIHHVCLSIPALQTHSSVSFFSRCHIYALICNSFSPNVHQWKNEWRCGCCCCC